MKSCVSGRLWAGLVLGLACVLGSALQVSASPQSGELFNARLFEGMRWRSIGPARGGRVLGVTGVRGEPEVYYFGAVGGGVWKTNDAGRTWKPIFDAQPVASIGAIAVAPSNREVIYVGSGEADMRSSISGGNGMYKSTDGGKSWARIGLSESRQIGRILVDPKDENRVFVAALGMRTGRTQSAAFTGRMTEGKTGSACFLKTKTPAQLIWRSSREIRRRFTQRCGRRGVPRGACTRHQMGREAGCSGRRMAASTGNR